MPMVGGVETHLIDLCNFFRKEKHEVYVRTYKAFGLRDRGLTNNIDSFIHIHRLWWPDNDLIFKLESYPFFKFFYLFTGLFFDCLFFLIKKNKSINVIQAHGFIAGLIAVILGKLFGKRIVINTHVGFRLRSGIVTEVIKWVLLRSDRVLVLTAGIKKSLVNLGIPDEKIDIYHYWVDQKKFSIQKSAKRKLGWEKKFTVLFIGRLIEVKGVRGVLDLAERLKDITFVIIGSGSLDREIDQRVMKYSNVLFLGKIENRTLPIYYNGADLLLIPSKIVNQQYEEGIPRVMIEALSCGLSVISTRSGGVPDVFSNKIGLLVEDNLESMVTAIRKIKNKRKLVTYTRNYALRLFSIKNAKIIEQSLQ